MLTIVPSFEMVWMFKIWKRLSLVIRILRHQKKGSCAYMYSSLKFARIFPLQLDP